MHKALLIHIRSKFSNIAPAILFEQGTLHGCSKTKTKIHRIRITTLLGLLHPHFYTNISLMLLCLTENERTTVRHITTTQTITNPITNQITSQLILVEKPNLSSQKSRIAYLTFLRHNYNFTQGTIYNKLFQLCSLYYTHDSLNRY